MRFIHSLVLFGIVFLFSFSAVQAEECRTIRSFASAHAKDAKNTVRIVDFEGPREIAAVATVLFKDYLKLAKDLNISETEGTHEVFGKITPEGEGYHLSLVLKETAKNAELVKADTQFAYPDRLSDALVEAMEPISRALKSPLPPKKLLPFVSTTTSSGAYSHYAQARQTLAGSLWTEEPLKKAQDLLEKTVQSDYNYVSGYLFLAEVLAARHRLTGDHAWKIRALKELEKSKLLRPPMGEKGEPVVRWYLEGKGVCGGGS